MPELPDLTVVAEELARRVAGRTVIEATAPTGILVRATPDELGALAGTTLGAARGCGLHRGSSARHGLPDSAATGTAAASAR